MDLLAACPAMVGGQGPCNNTQIRALKFHSYADTFAPMT